MALQCRLDPRLVCGGEMSAQVKEQTASIFADDETGDILQVILSVTGQQLEPALPFPGREPFFKPIGLQGGPQIGPFAFACG